jgi:sugar phosphate permease
LELHDGFGKSMRYRWVAWGILSLSYVVVFFHRVATGVVADNLMAEFGMGGAALGNLSAIYFYIYMVMQIPAGILADTLGARKTVTVGNLVAGTGSIAFGLAPSISIGYAGRFFVGLGVSVVFVSILKFQSEWFRESEFASVSGLTSFVGHGGSILAVTPLAVAVILFGWRPVFVAIGLVSVVLAVLNYVLVRNSPVDLGLPSITNVKAGDVNLDSQRPCIPDAIKSVLSNRWTWPAFLALMGFSGPNLTFTGMWGVPYMMAVYGFDKTRASLYITVMVIGTMAGCVIIGMISDRMGKRRLPCMVFGVTNLVMWMVLVFWNHAKAPVVILFPIMFVLGFSASAFLISYPLCKEVNRPDIAGTATGTLNIAGMLGAAVLQPLTGYVLDIHWTGQMVSGTRVYPQSAYYIGLMLCVIMSAIGVLGVLLSKETNCRNIYKLCEYR